MPTNQIVRLASLAGRIILENGGEVYRVEETVNRMCASYGMKSSQAYATPTTLIVSVTDSSGYVHTAMERIAHRTVNLDKIAAINDLSRRVEKLHPSPDEVFQMLEEIRSRKIYSDQTVTFFAALACVFISLRFGGGWADVFPALLGGLVIRFTCLRLEHIGINDFLINAIGGAIASLVGWLSGLLWSGFHSDIISISTLMLLVPGLIVTNAVRDIAAGDMSSGSRRLMEAFVIAIGIACGTAMTYTLLPTGGAPLWG